MSEKNRFPHSIAFRLDTPTFELLGIAAEAAGLSPGAWVRALVLKGLGSAMKAPKVRRAAANAVVLGTILDELKTQGRNLNQIARTANTTGSAAQIATDVAAMRAALEELVARILDLLRIEDDA